MIVLHNNVLCFMAQEPVTAEFMRAAADQLDSINKAFSAALKVVVSETPAPEPEPPPPPDYSAAACIKKREEMLEERKRRLIEAREERLESAIISIFIQVSEKGYHYLNRYQFSDLDVPTLKAKLEELGYIVTGDETEGLTIKINQ